MRYISEKDDLSCDKPLTVVHFDEKDTVLREWNFLPNTVSVAVWEVAIAHNGHLLKSDAQQIGNFFRALRCACSFAKSSKIFRH